MPRPSSCAILIELIDVTGLRDLSRLKGSLMERIYFQLRNDLQAVALATDLLADQHAIPPESGEILEMIKQQTDDAATLVEQAQGYLFTNLLELHQIDCYPVDPWKPCMRRWPALPNRFESAD